jgi:hypothetical protein
METPSLGVSNSLCLGRGTPSRIPGSSLGRGAFDDRQVQGFALLRTSWGGRGRGAGDQRPAGGLRPRGQGGREQVLPAAAAATATFPTRSRHRAAQPRAELRFALSLHLRQQAGIHSPGNLGKARDSRERGSRPLPPAKQRQRGPRVREAGLQEAWSGGFPVGRGGQLKAMASMDPIQQPGRTPGRGL